MIIFRFVLFRFIFIIYLLYTYRIVLYFFPIKINTFWDSELIHQNKQCFIGNQQKYILTQEGCHCLTWTELQQRHAGCSLTCWSGLSNGEMFTLLQTTDHWWPSPNRSQAFIRARFRTHSPQHFDGKLGHAVAGHTIFILTEQPSEVFSIGRRGLLHRRRQGASP